MQTIIDILNSIVGFFLAVILVVVGAFIVGYNAINIQQEQATNNYTIDIDKLQKNSVDNAKQTRLVSQKESEWNLHL